MMQDWLPRTPSDFVFYYASTIALVAYFLFRGKPRRGMLLRLRGRGTRPRELEGAMPLATDRFSRIRPVGERPLNVMFNYNGHSWDAYEVLGLPAGTSPEKVHTSYVEAMKNVDTASRGFLEAAYAAINAQWDGFKKVGQG